MPEAAQPPLRCLAAAALIVGAILAGAFVDIWIRTGNPLDDAYSAHYRAAIASIAGERTAWDRVVVTIGDSRIKQALPDPAGFAARAGPGRTALIRLVGPYAPARFDADLVRNLVALRPDLILIQEQSLGYDTPARPSIIGLLAERLRGFRRGLKPPASQAGQLAEFYAHGGEIPTEITPAGRDAFRRERERSALAHPRPDLVELISAGRAAGIRICLVEVPAEAGWDAMFATATERLHAFCADLARRTGAEPVPCPLLFTADEYVDLSHFNPRGRERFTTWLIDRLGLRP